MFAQHLQLQAKTVRQLLLVPLCPTGADFQDHFILQKFLYLMELAAADFEDGFEHGTNLISRYLKWGLEYDQDLPKLDFDIF